MATWLKVSIVSLAALAAYFCCLVIASAQTVTYTPIPAGFDFPSDQAALLKLRDAGDVAAMRHHSWMVFAGMTQPTATGEAVWETWYSADATFTPGPALQGAHPVERNFRNPQQFMSRGRHPQAVGASLLSFTLFDQETRANIRTNQLNIATHLDDINNGFAADTPVEQRNVPPFEAKAASVKTVWWVVKSSGLTALPVWDPDLNPPLPGGTDYPTWKRVVAIDPSRATVPANEKANVNFLGRPFPGAAVVALSRFYHFKISTREIAAVRALSAPGARTAQVGDYATLIAMHITTKEIPQWVWATFWWHDKADAGPFAADRPAAVSNVWRNYLMNTTFDMDAPKASDGGAPVCFNPYLEARFSNGTNSNCMGCHQKAAWPTDGNFLPITRGSLKPDDPILIGKTKTDFLWSLPDNAQ
jgi:hypothetical protein